MNWGTLNKHLHWERSVKRGGFCLPRPGKNILSLSGWADLLHIPLQEHLNASTARKAFFFSRVLPHFARAKLVQTNLIFTQRSFLKGSPCLGSANFSSLVWFCLLCLYKCRSAFNLFFFSDIDEEDWFKGLSRTLSPDKESLEIPTVQAVVPAGSGRKTSI